MTIQNAWNNITGAVRSINGNADAHEILRLSLETIRNELAKVPSVIVEPAPTVIDPTTAAAS